MNRRNFLTASAMTVFSGSWAGKILCLPKIVPVDPFIIKLEYPGPYLCISKSGYESVISCSYMKYMCDFSNLDAGWELTYVLVQEIEWDMRTAWDIRRKYIASTPESWDRSVTEGMTKRCIVTELEKTQIYIAISAMRQGETPEEAVKLALNPKLIEFISRTA